VHMPRRRARAYGNADELVEQIERAVKASDERKFIYAYCRTTTRSRIASAAKARRRHASSKSSMPVRRAALPARGTDSLVLATSDHGFIDVRPRNRSSCRRFFPSC